VFASALLSITLCAVSALCIFVTFQDGDIVFSRKGRGLYDGPLLQNAAVISGSFDRRALLLLPCWFVWI
jgi:hypothetical protein